MSTKSRQEEINVLSKDRRQNRRSTEKSHGHATKHKESKREQARIESQFYIDSFKHHKRLSSAWANDISTDEQEDVLELYKQALLDDHKTKLSETYPKEYSKIYTYELDFDDDDYVPPSPPPPPVVAPKPTPSIQKKKSKPKMGSPKTVVVRLPEESKCKSPEPVVSSSPVENVEREVSPEPELKDTGNQGLDEYQEHSSPDSSLVYHPPNETQLYGKLSCKYCQNNICDPVSSSDYNSIAIKYCNAGQQVWADCYPSSQSLEYNDFGQTNRAFSQYAGTYHLNRQHYEGFSEGFSSPTNMMVCSCRSSPETNYEASFVFGTGDRPVDINENENLLTRTKKIRRGDLFCKSSDGNSTDTNIPYCTCEICEEQYPRGWQQSTRPDFYGNTDYQESKLYSYSERSQKFEDVQQNDSTDIDKITDYPDFQPSPYFDEFNTLPNVTDDVHCKSTVKEVNYCTKCTCADCAAFLQTGSVNRELQSYPDIVDYPQETSINTRTYDVVPENAFPERDGPSPPYICNQERKGDLGSWRSAENQDDELQEDACFRKYEGIDELQAYTGLTSYGSIEYEFKDGFKRSEEISNECKKNTVFERSEEVGNDFKKDFLFGHYEGTNNELQEDTSFGKYSSIDNEFQEKTGLRKFETTDYQFQDDTGIRMYEHMDYQFQDDTGSREYDNIDPEYKGNFGLGRCKEIDHEFTENAGVKEYEGVNNDFQEYSYIGSYDNTPYDFKEETGFKMFEEFHDDPYLREGEDVTSEFKEKISCRRYDSSGKKSKPGNSANKRNGRGKKWKEGKCKRYKYSEGKCTVDTDRTKVDGYQMLDADGCINGETNEFYNGHGIENKSERGTKHKEADNFRTFEHIDNAFKEGTSFGRYETAEEKRTEDTSPKKRRDKCKECRSKRNKFASGKSNLDTGRKPHRSADDGCQVWDVDGCSTWKYGEDDQFSNSGLPRLRSHKFKQCPKTSEYSSGGKPVKIFKFVLDARQKTLTCCVSKTPTNS